MKKIIVDIYGADNGPRPIIEGTLNALKIFDDLGVIFVGNGDIIKKYCEPSDKIQIIESEFQRYGGKNR